MLVEPASDTDSSILYESAVANSLTAASDAVRTYDNCEMQIATSNHHDANQQATAPGVFQLAWNPVGLPFMLSRARSGVVQS